LTNAVRCCPPGNRTPAPAEAANCAPFLAHELGAIDPRIVVPIGRVALRAVGLRYLRRDPGPIRPLHAVALYAGERVIIPLIHPSRISRAQIEAFIEVMKGYISMKTDG
jgi:DNA polymerase